MRWLAWIAFSEGTTCEKNTSIRYIFFYYIEICFHINNVILLRNLRDNFLGNKTFAITLLGRIYGRFIVSAVSSDLIKCVRFLRVNVKKIVVLYYYFNTQFVRNDINFPNKWKKSRIAISLLWGYFCRTVVLQVGVCICSVQDEEKKCFVKIAYLDFKMIGFCFWPIAYASKTNSCGKPPSKPSVHSIWNPWYVWFSTVQLVNGSGLPVSKSIQLKSINNNSFFYQFLFKFTRIDFWLNVMTQTQRLTKENPFFESNQLFFT